MESTDIKYETIVQVMARSSSKRLKDKNIQPVGGHPLLAWSVRMAKLLPSVDRVIINTDSRDYADIAEEYGAETLFLRPGNLSGDTASISDVMSHAIWSLRHEYGLHDGDTFYAKLITFYPTSPFRNAAMCEQLIADLSMYKWVSVGVDTDMPWDKFYVKGNDGFEAVRSMIAPEKKIIPFFKGMGNFWGTTLKSMEKHKSVRKLTNPIECVDIDTWEDLLLMEEIVINDLYDFGVKLW
ncbi:cytidylyltransferase domain-containing protein [Salidesulfovibrio onnuriiensis]|uniref:cytidylyltransferase domain-containing protein n=1 Tax=Salidesulfovibrio onnuriiensis TaxID=2583823 RepID=UPI0011C7A5FE|nr:hypothetical protein [Salidesulfovibrio onnuriiensis]